MPGILFSNTVMLAGLAALVIPVLIHLLLKRKKKRLRFSTLQFFVKQDEQSSQRRKLRNWFLLALRLLVVTLLVLAFARPYLPKSDASGSVAPVRQIGRDEQVRVRTFQETLRTDESIICQQFVTLPSYLQGQINLFGIGIGRYRLLIIAICGLLTVALQFLRSGTNLFHQMPRVTTTPFFTLSPTMALA